MTPPLARQTSTQSALAAVSSRCAKRRTKRSKSCVCATSWERSTSSRTVLSRRASSSIVRWIATASAQMRARPWRASAWREKSRSPASLSSRAPTSSPRSTIGAQASERQPRRCMASRARRARPRSEARTQRTWAAAGSPSTGAHSRVGHVAPCRPVSSSPASAETASRTVSASPRYTSQRGAPVSSQSARAASAGTSCGSSASSETRSRPICSTERRTWLWRRSSAKSPGWAVPSASPCGSRAWTSSAR